MCIRDSGQASHHRRRIFAQAVLREHQAVERTLHGLDGIDLRTRFAVAAEGLRAPFNFDYAFNCDAASGVFAVQATVPVAGAFPFQSEAERNDARAAYSLRLAMALAAVAFGAGVGVVRDVYKRQNKHKIYA